MAAPACLLEISTRPFLWTLTQRFGRPITKLTDIPAEIFDDWSARGFDWVWFMGIWQLGPAGLAHDRADRGLRAAYDSALPGWTAADVIGSPYAVVCYAVNAELGTGADLRWLRAQLHARGIRLMVDFVPNHSATDAPEVSTHPHYYVRAPRGAGDPSRHLPGGIAFGCGRWCAPWTDVAQLNCMDRELRAFRIAQMKAVAAVADGMRCDMAHLLLSDAFWSYWRAELTAWGYAPLPTEFWADATAAVRAEFPACVFLAESYGDAAALHALGFDFTYDKEPLDRLRDGDVGGFRALLWGSGDGFKRRLAHFTENHDEPRAVEAFRGNLAAANAAAAALLTWPGLRFVNHGQTEGLARRIDVHLRRAVAEPARPEAVEFYARLFAVLNTQALREGEHALRAFDGLDTILTWEWAKGEEHVLVCVNFGWTGGGGNVICGDAPLSGDTIPVTDLMTGTVYDRDPKVMRTTGLTIVLGPYQVQIMKY
jgi:hypothetical protein